MPETSQRTYRLSPQQRTIWLSQRPGETFTAQIACDLDGPLDPQRLRQTVTAVARRHEILRTLFPRLPGMKVPDQAVRQHLEPAWRREEAAEDGTVEEILDDEAHRRWDLGGGSPLRTCLLHRGDDRHLLVLTLPSLCADAATLDLLLAEVLAGYAAGSQDTAGGDDEPVQYAQVADWLNALLEDDDEDARRGRDHWRRHPAAGRRPTRLPADGEEDAGGAAPGRLPAPVDGELATALAAAAQSAGVAPADLVLAAWLAVLWRCAGDGELVLGREHAGRGYDVLEHALGPCARTLPLHVRLSAGRSVAELAAELGRRRMEAEEHLEYYEPPEPVADTPPFSLGFRWDEPAPANAAGELTMALRRRRRRGEPFDLELTARLDGDALALELVHLRQRHGAAQAARLADRLRAVLAAVAAAPDTAVGRLPVVGDDERRRLVEEFNDRQREDGPASTVGALFVAQARRVPDRTALEDGEERLTYRVLERRSAALAAELRRRGVGPEVRVGIDAERRAGTVVAILAVLRAGGAYVPVDPTLPAPRRATLLRDSDARLWLGAAPPDGVELPVLDPAAELPAAEAPAPSAAPENLAYLLFTSGSTGRPKPVAVEHRQLTAYVRAVLAELELTEEDGDGDGADGTGGFAMVSTFGADLGNTALFPALCSGRRLLLVSRDAASSPAALAEIFRRTRPDVLKIVPSHLRALLAGGTASALLPRHTLVLGGEALDWELVDVARTAAPHCRVINHYGPTETTVGASAHRVAASAGERRSAGVPIGRPLADSRLYVVGPDLRPVPEGAPGELLIGGDGVSRGYLGRPGRTAVSFVPDPFSERPGARLYRSGDRVRHLPSGDLEFLGRIDQQIKVHGYRLEPGEVEAVLTDRPAVQAAAVALRTDAAGRQHLVAYVVPRDGAPPAAELRAGVQERLPEYMVPTVFVTLDSLPLNANGKVDRDALPAPDQTGDERPPYVAPRTPVEETLAEIWQQVLGVERVGVDDDFLQLGGDSILGIQMVARANEKGLRLLPRQVFEHPTLADLAAVAGLADPVEAEQGPVTGEVVLTPIQRRFLERDPVDPHHFNQALMLEVRRPLEGPVLRRALEHLLRHHDALRLRLWRDGDGWRQEIAAPGGDAPLQRFDLSRVDPERRGRRITELSEGVQGSLDLESGPLLRAALFDLGASEPQRLLLVVHHLAVDGVSWRVLLEDLAQVYEQLRAGRTPTLPAKTTSLKRWAEELVRLAASQKVSEEIPYWTDPRRADVGRLPLAGEGNGSVASERTCYTRLDAADTEALLGDAMGAHRADVREMLISALLRVLGRAAGARRVVLEVEGHGRLDDVEGIDLSRTVGWLTVVFPVFFNLDDADDPGVEGTLRVVKEQLHAVPHDGVGHGLLRYLGADDEVARALRSLPAPQVSLNYLGRLDRALTADSPFAVAAEYGGRTRSPRAERGRPLSVNASIAGGRLEVTWVYSNELLETAWVEERAAELLDELRQLIAAAAAPTAAALTPGDFPGSEISAEDLEKVLSQLEGEGEAG